MKQVLAHVDEHAQDLLVVRVQKHVRSLASKCLTLPIISASVSEVRHQFPVVPTAADKISISHSPSMIKLGIFKMM